MTIITVLIYKSYATLENKRFIHSFIQLIVTRTILIWLFRGGEIARLLLIQKLYISSQEASSISMLAVFKEKAFAIETINAAVMVAGAEYGKVYF